MWPDIIQIVTQLCYFHKCQFLGAYSTWTQGLSLEAKGRILADWWLIISFVSNIKLNRMQV